MTNPKVREHIMHNIDFSSIRCAIAEKLHSDTKSCLVYHPSLRLIGSWASNEAHLPPKINGCINSFSDIDLVYQGTLREQARNAIISKVRQSVEQVDVCISAISLRSYDEMSALPHAAEWDLTYQEPSHIPNATKYLNFWTAISAIESTILKYKYDNEDLSKIASYCITKFFFTLVRNIGILRELKFQSYDTLSQWINVEWKDLPASQACYVKTGKLSTLESTTAEQLIGKKTVKYLLCNSDTSPETRTITILARDFLNLLQYGKDLRPQFYFQIAHKAAYNSYLLRVVEYERRKLSRVPPFHQLDVSK